MRKLMLWTAMVAVALVAAAPALAQVSQEQSERRITSGAASPKTTISNTGNNVNLCNAIMQTAQTGNIANEQGVTQYRTFTDNIDFEGSTITVTPDLVNQCTQTLQQAAAAGPKAEAKAGKAEAKGGEAPPAPAPAPAPASAPAPVAQALPATGGINVMPLVGVSAFALLVGGGLLARRIIR